MDAAKKINTISFQEGIPYWDAEGTVSNEEMVLITQSVKELQSIMSNYVGIVRSDLRLGRAFDRLNILHRETEALYQRSVVTREICELRNMVGTAYLIIREAMKRKESLGLHYSIDYPTKQ
jgi:L-aspartate oxidase